MTIDGRCTKLAICGLAMLGAMAGLAIRAPAADAIKGGSWEFISQLQGAPMPHPQPGTQSPPGGGIAATQTLCIEPDKAVPTDPRQGCRIDRTQRNGGTVSWSGSCTTQQGTVRSDGVAHYSGETMDGTLTTRIPQPNGGTMDTSQRITGRYLGPCAAR